MEVLRFRIVRQVRVVLARGNVKTPGEGTYTAYSPILKEVLISSPIMVLQVLIVPVKRLIRIGLMNVFLITLTMSVLLPAITLSCFGRGRAGIHLLPKQILTPDVWSVAQTKSRQTHFWQVRSSSQLVEGCS